MGFWLVFVPPMAKLLHEVTDVVHITLGDHVLTLNLSLPFSWQTLFFASLFFSVGNLLISLLGPSIVMLHRDFESFNSAGKTLKHLSVYENKLSQIPPEKRKRLQQLADYSSSSLKGDAQDRFWSLHGIYSLSLEWVRLFCCIFYAIGFLLLADILLKQFLWVLVSLDLASYIRHFTAWP